MKPGATTRSLASMVRRAVSPTSPTLAMRPPAMPTSARRAGAPVPSTSAPFLIRRSSTTPDYRDSERAQILPHRLLADLAAHVAADHGGEAVVDTGPDARIGRLLHVILDARPLVDYAGRGGRAQAEF